MYHLRVRIFPDVHIQSSAMVLIEAYERAINSIHKIENASRVHTEFDGDIVFISAPLSTDHVRVFAISFVHVKYVCIYVSRCVGVFNLDKSADSSTLGMYWDTSMMYPSLK